MKEFKTDIEIARDANKKDILDLASERLNLDPKSLVPYGHDKAKIPFGVINKY